MKHTINTMVLSTGLLLSISTIAATYEDAVKLKRDGKIAEAETAFENLSNADPHNVLILEQLAVVRSWQQKFEQAIQTYRQALAVNPNYTSARAGLARVLYWSEKREDALTEIQRVLAEQPKNVDYHTLHGDILIADGQHKRAREAYKQAQALSKKPNAALTKKIKNAVGPKKWRIDAGFQDESYSRNRVDGDSSFVQLGYTFDNRTTIYARGEDYSSFGSSDTGITLGSYFSPIKQILINAEHYDNADNEDFRPLHQTTIHSEFYFLKTWQPLLSYRVARFNADDGSERNVTTVTPGLRYNYKNYGIEYKHARTENIDDSTTSADSLKVTAQFSRFAPYVFIVDGEEGVPPLTPAEIRIFGFGSTYKINNSFSVRFDFAQEDRNDVYINNNVGVGVSYFF